MRSHRRRTPCQQVLIAGTAGEQAAIQLVLEMLPETAYGQVLIETHPEVESPALDTPRRITVQPVGNLAEAIAAWTAEWLPEGSDPDGAVIIWRDHDLRSLVELT